jgi:hypothetical protein
MNKTINTNFNEGFNLGVSNLSRTTFDGTQNRTCNQKIVVVDNIAPIIEVTPQNQTLTAYAVLNQCTAEHVIENIFTQDKYISWTYTVTGATSLNATFRYNYIAEQHWLDKTVELNMGVNTITISAVDLSGNTSQVTYTVTVTQSGDIAPSVYAEEFEVGQINTLNGSFCGGEYAYAIESPLHLACENDTLKNYMWYYQLKDENAQVIYEVDSIPYTSGASIPLQVKSLNSYSADDYIINRLSFGYHHLSGGKVHSSNTTVILQDTLNAITCPSNSVVYNTNNATFTTSVTLPSPVANCPSSFWGYSITGATEVASSPQGVTYSSQQTAALTNASYNTIGYPSLAYNSNANVTLNNGIHEVNYTYLEGSGNGSHSYLAKQCTFFIQVIDSSSISLTCPPNDTIYRTDLGSCTISTLEACQQISGFNGAYGAGRFRLKGSNDKIILDQSNLPNSITFKTLGSNQPNNNNRYIELKANCSGTISFNWEYKTQYGYSNKPFIAKSLANNQMTGYTESSTDVQTGTFSVSVTAGEIVYVGLRDAIGEAYFKISNLSAPAAAIIADIAQPSFTAHSSLFYEHNIQAEYPIGNHQITYTLLNVNNFSSATCSQTLSIIDTHAGSLACSNQTGYLDANGTFTLDAGDVISTCFNTSNTTLSQTVFDCTDVGVNNVTITSYDINNQQLTCTFDLTIIDNLGPQLISNVQTLNLNNLGNAQTLTESQMMAMFTDICGIQSASASQTNFSCSNVGINPITLTATDVNGNVSNVLVNLNVQLDGFADTLGNKEYSVCQGSTLSVQSGSLGNSFSYYWQKKDLIYDSLSWNNLTKAPNVNPDNYGYSHKYIRDFKLNYQNTLKGIYRIQKRDAAGDYPTSEFYKLDTLENQWIKTNISFTGVNSVSSKFLKSYHPTSSENRDILWAISINSAIGEFELYKYNYTNNSWSNETDSYVGSNWSRNNRVGRILGDDGEYFFIENSDGHLIAGKMGQTFPSLYGNFHTVNSEYSDLYVTNAKNIVGIRNSLNQNMFFKMNLTEYGSFTHSKDSLTVDPTDGSNLFTMHHFDGNAYIAYKSSNAKLCVKKFDGTSSWSVVGALDFSDNAISDIDISSYNDTLFVLYKEGTGAFRVKKYDGTNWVSIKNPLENENRSWTHNARFINNSDKPQIHFCKIPIFNDIENENGFIVSLDGWKNVYANITNSSVNYYTVPTSALGTNYYRCKTTNYNGCATTYSGIRTVNVLEVPSIQTSDLAIVNSSSTTLHASTNAGTIRWTQNREATIELATGNNYTAYNIEQDTAFYAYAKNGVCYSDTLKATIFLNDDTFPNFNFLYADTICTDESVFIYSDSAYIIPDFKFSLYEKNSDGSFTKVSGPAEASFYVYPTQTTTYKVLVEENVRDHYILSDPLQYDNEHLSFGVVELPETDEITIESWVLAAGTTESNKVLDLKYSNPSADQNSPSSERNVEWKDGFFIVHNGSTSRSLAFPNFPGVGTWTHVATTADENGMQIYYDGVLVASNTLTSTELINHTSYPLTINKVVREYNQKGRGFDEFRLWAKKKSATEIQENMLVCMPEDNELLLIYNDFRTYNNSSLTFSSVLGNDAVIVNKSNTTEDGYPHVSYDGIGLTCGDTVISKKFLPEFTIHVLGGQNKITSKQDYPFEGNMIETCGEVAAPVRATSTAGNIEWYSAEEGGVLLGTSNSNQDFSFLTDKDTVIYAQASKYCWREIVYIDIIDIPNVYNVIHDTLCIGQEMRDVQINATSVSEGFQVYQNPTGGSPFDYQNDFTVLTENDTLYLEDQNQYCVQTTRTPFYINIFKGVDLNLSDYSFCGEGQADFELTYPGIVYFEVFDLDNNWLARTDVDPVFSTPILTDTTRYKVFAYHGNSGCYEELENIIVNVTPNKIQRDSILSCSPITWENGQTYAQSVSEVVLTRPQTEGCDSVYYLNLQVSDLESRYADVQATSVCANSAANFTVYASQTGKYYALVNTLNDDTLAKVLGNGSNINLQTTGLSQATTIKVVALDSLVNPHDTLVCEKNLVQYTINIGEYVMPSSVISCGSFTWRGNTYISSGVYDDTLTSIFGCDSILRLNLTINQPYNNVLNVSACSSYTYRGVTYTTSQQVVHRFGFTRFGCDSLETLNLSIGTPNTGTDMQVACGSYTWIDGITYTTSNNTATHVLTNASGCDSTVTLNLTINNSTVGTDTQVACDSYTWIDGNTYTSSNTTATHVLTNAAGCDSTVTLNLTVLETPTVSNPISASRCGEGTVNLAATSSVGIISWYDAANNGNLIGTGSPWVTPSISQTTTYYAEAVNGTCASASRTAIFATVYNCETNITSGCTETLNSLADAISFSSVSGAQEYRVRIQHAPSGYSVVSSAGTNTFFRLAWLSVNPVKYGTTYTISVAARVGGIWGDYSTPCSVTTPPTRLKQVHCGPTLTSLGDQLNFEVVEGAQAYRVEVRLTSTNAVVVVGTQSNPNFPWYRLNWITPSVYTFLPATSYTLHVSVQVDNVWQAYGPGCTVVTPISQTQLANGSCNVDLPALTSIISANPVQNATGYRYEFRLASNNVLVGTGFVTSSPQAPLNLTDYRLSWRSGLQVNTLYSVRVAAQVNGNWGNYGPQCTVRVVPPSGLAQNENNAAIFSEEQFLTVFPNPNNGTFIASASKPGDFVLLNSLGQIIQHISLTEENLNIEITNLSSGMYFLSGTVEGQQLVEKIVVE